MAFKGYWQHYKMRTLLKTEPWREIKLYISALRLIKVDHDLVDFIFTWPFLLQKYKIKDS